MIDKIAKNDTNQEEPNLSSFEEIREKLDYYRSLFGKIHDLPDDDFNVLQNDIATFFNIKPVVLTTDAPQHLIRISNNNKILSGQGKELSYLTDIAELLAPPIDICNFGRCNIPRQQVLYCATTEACAYWEVKPKKGDVITISHFALKPNAKINTVVIHKEKPLTTTVKNRLQEVYHIINDFFLDAYSLEVAKDRPRDYLFSALLSSEHLFYPIPSNQNLEAILYPSVQKKKFGDNFAIRNELMLEKYDLIGVETRFILDEYEDLDPATEEVTTDQVISSFGTQTFDFRRGEILYDDKVDELFNIGRLVQTSPGEQVRYEHEGVPKNLCFNASAKISDLQTISAIQKIGRNEKVSVVYLDGKRMDNVKYETIQRDLAEGKCNIIRIKGC